MKQKGFTLVEVVSVLVILAIVSLIVAPLILNTVRSAKISANKRSVDGYGRAAEYALSDYQLKQIPYPNTFEELEIDYTGSKVECEISRINPDHTIYLSKCKVNGKYVRDDSNKDGYYHYGINKMTNQEYVDTYGKNLEDALKKYHDEHNEYPSGYTELTLEELDKEVDCDVSINYDGTVYLTNCKVDNEEVLNENNEVYVYGKYVPSFVIGDVIEFAGSNWYVIEDSNTLKDYVTLLKETVLTGKEIGSNYIIGGNTANKNMAYYWSDTCHRNSTYGSDTYDSADQSGCTTNFEESKIKEMLETVYLPTLGSSNLKEVDGYKIRLIKLDELQENLGWAAADKSPADAANINVPSWVYQNFGEERYWTMTPNTGDSRWIWYATVNYPLRFNIRCIQSNIAVRPVINLFKNSIQNS